MFYPHLSEIEITRDEPSIDPKRELKLIQRRNSMVAEKVVTNHLLKNPKASKSAQKKLMEKIEFDERMATTKKFMETWNKWRDFYFDAKPIQVKNKSQLTCIEKILEMVKEHNLNLSILIGSVHRAHLKRRYMPGFTTVLSFGLENYQEFSGDVVTDIDKAEFESESYE